MHERGHGMKTLRGRRVRSLAAFLALTCAVAGCSSAGSGGGSGSGVTIALVEPFSGDVAYYGEYINQTWQLAIANDGASPGGHKLSFKRFDDQCTPAKAQTAVRQVVGDDSIVVAEGPGCTGPFLAAQPTYVKAKFPHVEIVFGSTATTSGDDHIVRVQTSDADLMTALAAYMKTQNVDRLAVVNDTSGYSVDIQQTLDAGLAKANLKAATHLTFAGGATDFSGQISRLKSDHITDVALGCYDTDCGHFVKQAFQQGLKARIWGAVTTQTEDFTKAIGSNYKDLVDGGKVIFASDFIPTNPNATVQKFVTQWRAKFHSVPTTDIASMYTGHQVIQAAVKSIKGKVTRENIMPALKAAHLTGTPMGDVAFTDTGELKCPPLYIGDWVNGQPHLLKNMSAQCSGLS